ncbi:hypothetical protein FOG51_02154 [Hanseniaspora uvarum]|nr:hypothetical protein FOG51_02154 [Hanseniaspora uvarum]KAF0275857.1 hypothetical protein FOG50_03231 [Hanseniaspora uvarum]
MIQFLIIINDKGILRYQKTYLSENTVLLDNLKILEIYQQILKLKNRFDNNFKIDDSFKSNIIYRQYSNLYFIIGYDSDVVLPKYNILIHKLVENIDLKFNNNSSESNIINNNMAINDIIESMEIE